MSKRTMPRRTALGGLAAGIAGAGIFSQTGLVMASENDEKGSGQLKGRIKQSVSRWCYGKIPLDEFCAACKKMGLVGVDLVGPDEWPVLRKHGLIPTMTAHGAGTIGDGLNEKANHAKCREEFKESLDLAVKNNLKRIITFSGNRRKLSDEEGMDNCYAILKDVAKEAEDKGVIVCMELLNSKVDHKDYMCDRTAWGVELCKRVDSPNFKLLYDIYHMQIMEGDIIRTIRDNIQYLAHFHTGGNPGRNEIDDTQELYYPAIMQAIVDLNYDGYVAHEFVPKRDPLTSLHEAVLLCDV